MTVMRVFVLGLDGATFDLILPLVKEGFLPTFQSIIEGGVWGPLKSTIPPLSGPAWVSFSTGLSPAKHGIFDFIVKKPKSYETYYINSKNVRYPFFWEIASRYGKKVGVINVMVTYPPRPVNGFLVTGGLTPSLKEFTYPPDFGKKLLEKFGTYPYFPPGGLTPKKGEDKKYVEKLLSHLDKRIEITRYLLKNVEWDVFVSVLEETDSLQHAYLGLMDRSKIAVEAIKECYKRIDVFLNEIINKILDDKTTLILMSDHGHGPLKKYIVIGNFLLRMGVIRLKKSVYTKIKSFLFNHGFTLSSGYRLVKALGFRRAISMFRGGEKENLLSKLVLSYNDIDWHKTKAFPVGAGGGIYINLKGREPFGCVSKEDYGMVKGWLTKLLYSLRDEETGENVVERVFSREEVYGDNEDAPDLVFLPKKGYSVLNRLQFVSNSIFEFAPSTGTHTLTGIFMAYGSEVKQKAYIENAKIWDLAPTILHLLNLPIPTYMDGVVLKEIFRENSEYRVKPIKFVSYMSEREAIRRKVKRLKGSLKH